MIEIIVEEPDLTRLDRVLKTKFKHLPQSLIEKLVRTKQIKLSNTTDLKVKAGTRVKQGDIITITNTLILHNAETSESEEAKEKFYPPFVKKLGLSLLNECLLFSCDDFIAINKPYGIPVQGGSKVSLSIDDALKYLNDKMLSNYRLVHRLDRDTSGVLIIAKNLKSCRILGKAFKNQELKKTYLAICAANNAAPPTNGMIENYIGKSKAGTYEIVKESKNGKLAKTLYKIVGKQDEYYFIEYTPLTGRSHQLRFHSKQLGCPILGDRKYGGPKHDRMMLHAMKIVIPKSLFGTEYVIKAPTDKYFEPFCS